MDVSIAHLHAYDGGMAVAVRVTILHGREGCRLEKYVEMCSCTSFFIVSVFKEEVIPHLPSNYGSTYPKSDTHSFPCARHCGKVLNVQEMGQAGCRSLVLDLKELTVW